jgi:hypothetical protein
VKFSLLAVFIAMAGVLVLDQPLLTQESQPEKPKAKDEAAARNSWKKIPRSLAV